MFFSINHSFQVVQQVSCGAVHVVALSEDGLLQAWGNVYLNSILKISMLDILVWFMHLVVLVRNYARLQFEFTH